MPTSRLTSRGSLAPRNVRTTAAPGGYRIAIMTRSGKPTLIVIPRQAGTGMSSMAAMRTLQRNHRASKSTVARETAMMASVGRETASCTARNRPSCLRVLACSVSGTATHHRRSGFVGKVGHVTGNTYAVRRTPMGRLVG
jgi:hypothetical protein